MASRSYRPLWAALPNSIVICFVLLLLFFFLHICNFMLTKPNKVKKKMFLLHVVPSNSAKSFKTITSSRLFFLRKRSQF